MPMVPVFRADFPGAIVAPANLDNVYAPAGHGGVPNRPRAFVLHTPEEKADGYPGTPAWFASYHPNQRGSTHYFVSYPGRVYQCVPETWGAIANGFNPGDPQRLSYPAWAGPFSLNWQTLSVEIEGYAANIAQTLIVGGPQWKALVALVRNRCIAWEIPLDRAHIPGHYQLAVDRYDPGALFPWAELIRDVQTRGGDVFVPFHKSAKLGAGVPGSWKGSPWNPGVHKMNVRLDCDLPPNARMVRLDIRIAKDDLRSSVAYGHGGGGPAGSVLGTNALIDVIPNSEGMIDFAVLGGTIRFELVDCLGYWTW